MSIDCAFSDGPVALFYNPAVVDQPLLDGLMPYDCLLLNGPIADVRSLLVQWLLTVLL